MLFCQSVRWLQRLLPAVLLALLTTALLCSAVARAQGEDPPVDGEGQAVAINAAQVLNYRDVAFAPGELLIGIRGEGLSTVAALSTTVMAAAAEGLDLRGLDGATGNGGVTGYLLHVPAGEEWALIEALLQDPAVAFAEPNWLVYAAVDEALDAVAKPETPFSINDPRYAESQWYLQRINASRAWSLAYADDGFDGAFTDIQVAIIDSGIDVNHPEFRGRLLAGYNYLVPGSPPTDDYGHGTHVAGLLGAVANNAVGIAGVAPKVKIDARKVLNSQGVGTISNVAKAIREAAESGAEIINMSLEASAPNATMGTAVQFAASQGVLLIAASGNSGASNGVSWPAAYDEVMAVAATNYNDRRASYSNAGAQIEIAAPGGERNISMLSTWPGSVRCRDTTTTPTQSTYCTSEGTSMAAAVVSGAAALIKSVRPSMSAEAIRSLLRDTALPTGEPASFVGSGRLDIQEALRRLMPASLQLADSNLARTVGFGAQPYVVSVRLDNPSYTPLPWEATLLEGSRFVQVSGAVSGTISGTLTYGEPVYLSVTISPTNLITGVHLAALQIESLYSGVQRTYNVDLTVSINPPQNLRYSYFPLILMGTETTVVEATYRWEAPTLPADRQVVTQPFNAPVDISLPSFTFTLQSEAYTALKLYPDGFVSFADGNSTIDALPNRCLPDLAAPAQAIYGWWADLNPTDAGTRVSYFQPGSDRFVIEFDNVPSAAGVSPAYRVSFQIVLYDNGDVMLNYRNAPDLTGVAPHATIGVEARDGLFHNQVACKNSTMEVGYLPTTRQSLFFRAEKDIY